MENEKKTFELLVEIRITHFQALTALGCLRELLTHSQ